MEGFRHATAFVLGLAALAFVTPARAEDNPALLETLQIMRDRGLIDDAKHAELVAKNQAWEASHPSLLSRLEWAGDFRGRLENFWYDEDDFGVDSQDRTRGRYRLRIGAKAKVNEVVSAGFMIASGDFDDQDGTGSGCDHRSSNRSFGTGTDFNMDSVCIDLAYAELSVPKRFLPESMTIKTIVGKQVNPFVWKYGKDILIWDNDITPEGMGLQVAGTPMEGLSLFGNAGYFISDENGSAKDPHLVAVQGGFGLAPWEHVELGGRASWYGWNSVTDAFLTTSSETGSLITGAHDYNTVELASYLRLGHSEQWPVLFYGQIAQNLDADSGPPGVGDEDLGWGAGIEVGDKKKLVMIGAGYYHIEANVTPAQFVESDLFDGFTNREGFLVYAGREIFTNTELNLTLFKGDVIDDGDEFDLDALFPGTGVTSADRYRLQTDLVVKF